MLTLVLALMLQAPPAQNAAVRPGTAVIAGQLKTIDGAPAADVRVSALQAPPANVRPEDGIQYYLAPPPVRTVLTDKDGRYRLTNLPPGRYFVAAGIPGQDTYYPDAIEGSAATILTVTGDTTTTVDFALVTPLAGRISGKVVPAPEAGSDEKAILSGVFLTDLVEAPIQPDGSFEFGRVPEGTYLVDLFPSLPGLQSVLFDVSDKDVNNIQLRRPKLYTVSGRFKVAHGPLPWALFAFYTSTSYAAADIKDDGTFTVKLNSAKHFPDLGGMPSDYDLTSLKLGNEDVTKGLVVGDHDVTGLVVNVSAPNNLPRLHGRITGLPAAQLAKLQVQINGPIFGVLQSAVKSDGSFDFPEVVPGAYWLKILQYPQMEPLYVAMEWENRDIAVAAPR